MEPWSAISYIKTAREMRLVDGDAPHNPKNLRGLVFLIARSKTASAHLRQHQTDPHLVVVLVGSTTWSIRILIYRAPGRTSTQISRVTLTPTLSMRRPGSFDAIRTSLENHV